MGDLLKERVWWWWWWWWRKGVGGERGVLPDNIGRQIYILG
jgi:hypothetical protein